MIPTDFHTDWYVQDLPATGPEVGPVTVPYDAMLYEQRDADTPNKGNTGFFPGGTYRYRKDFFVPELWEGLSITLELEGVYHRSEVSVNGIRVGGTASGYAIFHVPLDSHLTYGAQNTVEVIAHNDDAPNSRWYTGSGIYRPVHLLIGEQVHVTPFGLRIVTDGVTGGEATLLIDSTIINQSDTDRHLTIRTTVTGPDGSATPPADTGLRIVASDTVTTRQTIRVPDAALWSTDTPHLYEATVELVEDGTVLDTTRESFGIRTLTVDAARGLQINGTTVKLRGACIHHDNGVIGAHTLDAAENRRIRILKEAGFNAIRSAHNPVSTATLRACDQYGMLVMDELTDVWFRSKTKNDSAREFAADWEHDLEVMVLKDINHPSVILYSIGNEIQETALSRGITQNRRMAELVRRTDPTRLVTNGINGFLNLIAQDDKPNKKKQGQDEAFSENLIGILNLTMGALDKALPHLVKLPAVDKKTKDAFAALDVAGYNYIPGRYEKDGRLYPHRVIVGTETSPAQVAHDWKLIERLPHVIGDFVWTGWDYIGEAGLSVRAYNSKRKIFQPYPALLAGTPIIDITGHRQTQSYHSEIIWHLATGPHIAVQPVNHAGEKQTNTSWRASNSVASWSWDGCEGRNAVVEVYADAARVKLILNGKTVGIKPSGADHDYTSVFTVPYDRGALTAIAFDHTGHEIGRQTLQSAGPEVALQVTPETTTMQADGQDLAYLPITITDSHGVVKSLSDRTVHVTVDGPATLLGLGSANPITTEGFNTTSHSTYFGRAMAVLRAGHHSGTVTVTVTADNCEPVTAQLEVQPPQSPLQPDVPPAVKVRSGR